MANPNIRNLTSLVGNTAVAIATTSYATLVSNSAGSNTIVKVVSMNFANVVSSPVSVYAKIVRSSTDYIYINNITVPANSSFAAIGKDAPLYLLEGDTLQIYASANSSIHVISSNEVIA